MTDPGSYGNNEKSSRCGLKDSKRVISVSEAFITEDDLKLYKPKTRPPVPTVKDTILVPNQANVKPLIPTVNETVLIDKQHKQISSRKQEVETTLSESVEKQDSDNIKDSQTRIFIDKKKKERAEKNKLDLIEKKKFFEDRKKRLAQLQKTTKELAKGKKSKTQKTVPVDDENKSDKSLPNETYRPQSEIKTIDQTWSPLSTLPKSFKKAQKTPIKVQSKLENSNFTNKNGYSDTSTNITKTTSNYTNSVPQSSLIEKNSHLREVMKPENIYSKLQLDESYLLTDNTINNDLRPKIIRDDAHAMHNDCNNVKLNEEMCHGNEIVNEKCASFSMKMCDINLQQTNSTNVGTEKPTDLQLPDEYDEKIRYFNANNEIFSSNLFDKKTCSESTQTDNFSNILWVASESLSPMNLNSILECKSSLPLRDKNDLKFYKPMANLSMNGVSISSNKNTCENDVNNVESIVLNILDLECSDKVPHKSNLNFNETENCANATKFLLMDENTNLRINTYKDIKQIMKKINCDLEFFTKKNSSHTSGIVNCEHLQFGDLSNLDSDLDFGLPKNNYNNTNDVHYGHSKLGKNNLINSSSSSLPKIHDEFQAELDMLDQLNDSLRDIEKMNCDSSIKNNKQSFDEMNDLNVSNDLNMKMFFNFSHSNNIPTHCSKLNSLSSSMMSADKTITNFSILMFEQLIKDEEFRAKQHLTINSLREKSLVNRLTWEATMCDLQATNFKNPLGHSREFQMFKQQHRGRLKKLENSLSQVKRLGRVIDSVYKRRIIMLQEHLQYLRMQSSSKKVIRKLNSLDNIPKKEENVSQQLNTHLLNKHDKTDSVDIIERKTLHKHYSEPIISLENNTSQTVFQTDKPEIISRNQATSPIIVETENLKPVDNIKVQTHLENFYIDKSVQTSKTLFHCSNSYNKNRILFDPIDDLSNQNELLDVDITNSNDKKIVPSLLSTSPIKVMCSSSESSISTISEHSEMDMRLTTLQEQLEVRKIESSTLRKKQKKLKLESLKAKEQDILKQIEMYDKRIEESKKSLMVEIEKKSVQLKNNSIKNDICSKHSITSDVPMRNINIENEHAPKQHSQNVSDKIKYNNSCVPQDKLMCELQQKITAELKENLSRFTNKSNNSEMFNNRKHTNYPLQSSEASRVSGVVPLHKKPIVLEVVPSNPRSEDVLIIHALNDSENYLRPKTCSSEINEVLITSKRPEKSARTEKFTASYESVNDDLLNTNSSKNSVHQKINFSDSNINMMNDVSEEINFSAGQLEASNNETVVRSVDYSSLDFTSIGNLHKSREPYKLIGNNDNLINEHNSDQENESSYEEDRSEGEVIFEDKTFIEHYSSGHDPFQDDKPADDKVDVITDNIFNSLIKDIKNTVQIKKRKPLSFTANNELNNLTEETPLLMILKREEDHQNMIILQEQAKSISDLLFKRNLHQILNESLQMYLPKLNETEAERLKLYLNWSSNRKKVKLSAYLKGQYNTSNVESDESFEIVYQKHQEQKTSSNCQDESSNPTLAQQETEKFELEQSPVEEEIEQSDLTEESNIFLREIPNKPPPPYKSPTKKIELDDVPYTPDEVRAIVLTAATQLFRDPQSSMSNDYMNNVDSSVHVDYKKLIFDYCKEIAEDMYFVEEKVPPWKKPKKKLKHFRGRPKNPEELCDAVVKKLNQIKDVDNCEEKVNAFVVKQMYEEDSKWIDFQMDEMNVLNDVVQSLMNKLICDTVKNVGTNCCLKLFN